MTCPFPGPLPFLASQSDIFFGRKTESAAIADRLLLTPVLVVYGPSGCGKTSLLDAGVPTELRSILPNCTVLSFREWVDDFPATLRERIVTSAQQNHELRLELPGHVTDLPSILNAVAKKTEKSLFLFLDQFEQLFGLPLPVRTRFLQELAGAVHSDDTATNFIIGIREDKLALLHSLRHLLPDLFQNLYHVEPLRPKQALEAVKKPLQRLGRDLPGFSTSVVRQLLRDDLSGDFVIDPMILQIVLQYYWPSIASRSAELDDVNVDRAIRSYVRNALGSCEEHQVRQLLELLLAPFSDLRRPVLSRELPPSLANVAGQLNKAKLLTELHVDGHLTITHDKIAEQCHLWRLDKDAEEKKEEQEKERRRREASSTGSRTIPSLEQVLSDGLPWALVRESQRAEQLNHIDKSLRLLRRAVFEVHRLDDPLLKPTIDSLFLRFLMLHYPDVHDADVAAAFRLSWAKAADLTPEELKLFWGTDRTVRTPRLLQSGPETMVPARATLPSDLLTLQDEIPLLEY